MAFTLIASFLCVVFLILIFWKSSFATLLLLPNTFYFSQWGGFATEPFFSLTSCPLFCFSLISFWFQVSVCSCYEQKLKLPVHMIWNNLKAQICLVSKSCGWVFHSAWAPVQPHQYKPVARLGLGGHGTARELARNSLWLRLFCTNININNVNINISMKLCLIPPPHLSETIALGLVWDVVNQGNFKVWAVPCWAQLVWSHREICAKGFIRGRMDQGCAWLLLPLIQEKNQKNFSILLKSEYCLVYPINPGLMHQLQGVFYLKLFLVVGDF